jgi:hypothetical protein
MTPEIIMAHVTTIAAARALQFHLRVPSDPLRSPEPFPAPEPVPPPVRRPSPDSPENPDMPLPGPDPIEPRQI